MTLTLGGGGGAEGGWEEGGWEEGRTREDKERHLLLLLAGLWVLPGVPGRWPVLHLPGTAESYFLQLPVVCDQRSWYKCLLITTHVHHPA